MLILSHFRKASKTFHLDFKMYAKTFIISSLLASVSLVTAAPLPQAGVAKRCIGSCNTTNENTVNNTDTATTTNSNGVNTAYTQQNNGNSQSTGNSGGGNSFGNAHVGKVCRRELMEARGVNAAHHVFLAARKNEPHPAAHPAAKAPGMNFNQNWAKTNTTNKTNVGSNNVKTNINNTKTNSVNMSNNSGQINGSGVVCRREFEEAEMERRELDSGAAVLAALGGQSVARSLDEPTNLLATRDLGRLADVLGVRAAGHDMDESTHYRRDIGLECASASCDGLARREAESLLMNHARDLGFSI